ncbi:3-deoxy-D-manno-octulosonic acid transferase [Mesoterricola silvestris]|uniref:3-deoxy-D-manno-octulosonic acid transferase n=1 Tax=Mesoterricola silvestris TaxID=2927979 RepID=A0AA48KAA4_9BACT|nr:glycosyltransferase N-terminal domain-containing protein [Mesoterricola silvestris]BDU74421.1 3-deoxy-D-manno-octulosonic acid transferase [Mesoterricola silvestris]
MDLVDSSYLGAVALAGAVARALARGLPPDWRLRLEAAAPEDLPEGWLWLHAVSVGELLLAEGILAVLRDRGHHVHVTTGTANGLALLERRLAGWDGGTGRVTGGAFPLDDPRGLASFLKVPPGAFVCLETEIWPNLLRELEALGVPRCVVNGRLTRRSLQRGGAWMARAASRLTVVAARDEASAALFRELGAPRVELGGNLKADLPPPRPLHGGWAHLRRGWAASAILVAGNTVEGEETLVLEAWDAARKRHPHLRLILAPRQPRRFQEAAGLLAGRAFRRASEVWPQTPGAWEACDILLLDTLGDLASAYREGTLALVAGGWTWHGGHNPLEPVRWGLPTLVGPGFTNFEDLVGPLRDAGLVEVVPAERLGPRICDLLDSLPLRPAEGGNPVPYPEGLAGSLEKTVAILKNCLPPLR